MHISPAVSCTALSALDVNCRFIMSVQTYLYRFIVTNFLTLYYSVVVLFFFAFNYLKNPFRDPFALKLRLEPPSCLKDPKYGTHKYIKVNDIKLHYVESGDPSKRLMLFVHGFPEFWYSWRYQILEFQKDYWCIAIDMRGYGDSERPDGVSSYKLELLVEDIRDLIRQLGRDKCVIVSQDWGGAVSCKLRDVYPDVLDALILFSSTSRESLSNEVWSNQVQFKKTWYVLLMRMPGMAEKLLQMNNLEAFDKMIVPGKNTITKDDVECYKYWFGKQHTLTPPVNYYRANFDYIFPEKKVCQLNIPFLAAISENDDFIVTSLLDGMKKEYKCIETVVLKNCGHFATQEEPEMANKMIRDFLSKHNL